MSLFRRPGSAESSRNVGESDSDRESRVTGGEADVGEQPSDTIEGERGVTIVNRARSLQSRVSSVLAVGLMSALGLGLLTWYYAGALSRQARAQQTAQSASKARAQGEMPLPSLGKIEPPQLARTDPAKDVGTGPTLAERVLGPPPELPDPTAAAAWREADALTHAPSPYTGPPPKPPGQRAVERRLEGPVFAKQSTATMGSTTTESSPSSGFTSGLPPDGMLSGERSREPARRSQESGVLSPLLEPSVTTAVRARVLPTQRFLLAKGAFLDCTLETAIDSTLPGITTCVTATDTFGVDGDVVLLERGTKLVGETRGQVQQGASRLFVLWTEARTPTGVIVPLASPGTDELGRAGLPGEVNRHFWDRFGAAILVSIIDGAVQAGVQSASHNGGTVILNPTTSQDVMTEVLRSTVAIAPTITKQQGDRIQVLVARDIDFRSVYELKIAVAGAPAGTGNP